MKFVHDSPTPDGIQQEEEEICFIDFERRLHEKVGNFQMNHGELPTRLYIGLRQRSAIERKMRRFMIFDPCLDRSARRRYEDIEVFVVYVEDHVEVG